MRGSARNRTETDRVRTDCSTLELRTLGECADQLTPWAPTRLATPDPAGIEPDTSPFRAASSNRTRTSWASARRADQLRQRSSLTRGPWAGRAIICYSVFSGSGTWNRTRISRVRVERITFVRIPDRWDWKESNLLCPKATALQAAWQPLPTIPETTKGR